MKFRFATFVSLLFLSTQFCFSQNSTISNLQYEVNRILPPISLSKDQLIKVQTLSDLDSNFKTAWVREYISVEVIAQHNGKTVKETGKNSKLNQAQKNLLNTADVGKVISVKVQYIPENTLKNNDPKEMEFSISIDPENKAEFPGGHLKLLTYLEEKVINKIPDGVFKQHQLAAVTFTIDEQGQILTPAMFWSSENDEVDKIMLNAISEMPNWKPASYANGLRVKQAFAFTVGDMKSCVVNLLNIRRSTDY